MSSKDGGLKLFMKAVKGIATKWWQWLSRQRFIWLRADVVWGCFLNQESHKAGVCVCTGLPLSKCQWCGGCVHMVEVWYYFLWGCRLRPTMSVMMLFCSLPSEASKYTEDDKRSYNQVWSTFWHLVLKYRVVKVSKMVAKAFTSSSDLRKSLVATTPSSALMRGFLPNIRFIEVEREFPSITDD